MKPGQKLTQWFQDYAAGRLTTPQAIYAAAWTEAQGPGDRMDRFFDTPPDDAAFTAPERLRAPVHLKSTSYMRQRLRADWAHCDPRLMWWAAHFCNEAAKRQIPLYVHCALRSRAEQDRVFKAGHSKARYPSSAHNIGEAVDIVHGTFHWDMTRQEWAFLHALGQRSLDRVNANLPAARKLSLRWGGSFASLYDPAHWEVADYRSRLGPRPATDPEHLSPWAILERVRTGRLQV